MYGIIRSIASAKAAKLESEISFLQVARKHMPRRRFDNMMRIWLDKRFKKAGVFWSFILKALRAHAIVMPWGRCYVLPHYDSASLRKHELVHLAQVKRYGAIGFTVRYLYWYAKVGYYWHPMEVEARVKAGEDEAKESWLKDPVLGPMLREL